MPTFALNFIRISSMKRLEITTKRLSVTVFIFFASLSLQAVTPAFPGAEGGGMYTTGGRGGTVYYVNSLADTNVGNATTKEGTLRWCVGRSGTRTILFKVSGVIALTSRLNIGIGNLTIAGQSAPGDGICLKGYDVTVNADNVIIRYMRFRLGDVNNVQSDAIWGRYRNNIILDHCSMSWSVDECASFYSNNNFTMQWCLLAESLRISIHDKNQHGYCGLWGGKNATFHHNLMAHHDSRNPRFNGWKRSGLGYANPFDEERMDFRNNVVYNWGSKAGYGGEAAGKYNVVNNYYRPGPATSSKTNIVQIDKDASTNYLPIHGKFYLTGNYLFGNTTITSNNRNGVTNNSGFPLDTCLVSVPYPNHPITQHTAVKTFEKVLDFAGASLKRDTVDLRIVREARDGTFTHTGSNGSTNGLIDSQTDVGGWPTYASTTAPTDTNIDGIPDEWLETYFPDKTAIQINEEGYTYLEVYLNNLVKDITVNQNLEGVISSVTNPEVIEAGNIVTLYESSSALLRIETPKATREVCVYSLEGRLIRKIMTEGKTSLALDGSDLSQGIYLIRLYYIDGSTGKAKVMVVHQ
jgi:hypothetical protein